MRRCDAGTGAIGGLVGFCLLAGGILFLADDGKGVLDILALPLATKKPMDDLNPDALRTFCLTKRSL